ncbi:diaminopimelate dehydrogenase [Opitutus terrae]|uniref:Meso-diaminopimelate D-dehydrogenase n=1 Tax=Opitutus terrae (strain DSM 11246 / JCM 15787 / PB90-1) TaxID=452637 RepID=B2A092_OPITP|nr:diaminopimelate dehydrogenase [Opitutus terrae]ACB77428.1 diaminopimelate dehydrogenase [Opitutus terrae PB90-1]
MATTPLRIAVVSYGNIGRAAIEAVQAASDMALAGVVRRRASAGQPLPPELTGIPVVDDVAKLGHVDVALLCGPTRSIPDTAPRYLRQGIHTVDSFDIHGAKLWELRQSLDAIGKQHASVAVVSAGWDPGSDSVMRTLLLALAPRGLTYTNFGPGMSMGHSVCAKSKPGVKDALSMTIPVGTGVHRRMVYVELEPGANFAAVEQAIKTDEYFAHDDTRVFAVPSIDALKDMGHGVLMQRKGVSGATHNQLFEFRMTINNPALTAQIMVSCARAAALRLQPGAYTMPEIPPLDLLPGSREDLIKALV